MTVAAATDPPAGSASAQMIVPIRREVSTSVASIPHSLTRRWAPRKHPFPAGRWRRAAAKSNGYEAARFLTSATRLRRPSVAVSIRLLDPFLMRNPGTGITRSTVSSKCTRVASPPGVRV